MTAQRSVVRARRWRGSVAAVSSEGGGTKKKKKTASSRPASPSSSSSSSSSAERTGKKEGGDGRLWTGIALIVAVLAGLVWWSLPGESQNVPMTDDAGSSASEDDEDDAGLGAKKRAKANPNVLERPPHASVDLAILTDKPEDVVKAIANVSEIAKRLDTKYCGGACDAVRKLMSDEDAFELDVRTVEDLILPPSDTMDTVAADLPASERALVSKRKNAVSIRTSGRMSPEQLPARAGYAAAAILAEALDGVVYDEVARRIESARTTLGHVITAPLGQPVFAPRQIVVQLYRQEDGTARLLTLGMARLGSPDLSMRGANMTSGPHLVHVINYVAKEIASGKNDTTLTITLDDIARFLGKKPGELNPNAGGARPVTFDITEPERQEGDPDNELAELVPKGGATRENWDNVIASLFGGPSSVSAPVDDKELNEVAAKARRDLPAAIKRFQAGEGDLYVKGPFAIPDDARVDGGAASEQLWIAAVSCDDKACTGTLSNEPTQATNLAAGKTVSVSRKEAVDWMLQLRDGGVAGGESIKVLKARLPK